jgi:hypothetical protein
MRRYTVNAKNRSFPALSAGVAGRPPGRPFVPFVPLVGFCAIPRPCSSVVFSIGRCGSRRNRPAIHRSRCTPLRFIALYCTSLRLLHRKKMCSSLLFSTFGSRPSTPMAVPPCLRGCLPGSPQAKSRLRLSAAQANSNQFKLKKPMPGLQIPITGNVSNHR